MRAKHRFWLAALVAIATPAIAQEAPAPGLFMNQAGVEQTIALIASRIKPDQPVIFQPLVGLGTYRASLEYRQGVSGAATHEAEAEWVQVVEGSGTLVTGGRLETPQRTGPTNLTGHGIIGGSMRPITKGDMLIIPEGTPHWFSQINGRLILITMKLPRGAKPAP
ncbi:cupin domain-containing protein [Novosphingobium terrae]|uniref:cupin domain-containing protein n=1 Tax=Novosphingobium terrae TaxID=2726189 RepID=UPI001981CC9F|nr:cupin domain-containing protein [Novosphingobium terrae]